MKTETLQQYEIFSDELLAEHGLRYVDGALLDSNDNYVESFSIDGKTMESLESREGWLLKKENDSILATTDYKYDEYSNESEFLQKEAALAKYYVEQSHKAPLTTVVPKEVMESYAFQEAFEKDSLAKVKLINKKKEKELVLIKEKRLEKELFKQNILDKTIDVGLVLLLGVLVFILGKKLSKWYSQNYKSFSMNKIKYYLYSIIFSLIISLYFGFKFKTPNSSLFGEIIRSDKNREHIIDYYSSKESFFGLNKFSFNWELFIILMILFFAIIIFLGNTIYYDRISAFINRIKQK